ncbi:MAG: hypothetical protein ACFBSF_08595 [Leptolyngbyaceae cyanobacterium]
MNPYSAFCLDLGLAQDCHVPIDEDLGFPEFESIHSADFSTEAQFSKSVASTIPPRPPKSRLRRDTGIYILQMKPRDRLFFYQNQDWP